MGQNQGPTILEATSSPVQIPGTTWNHLESFKESGFGTKTDGTLWTWGTNTHGALGQNTAHNVPISSPIQIPGTTWSAVGNGGRHQSYHVKTDGTLWSWGYNGSGHLGQNNTVKYSSPVQVGSDTDWESISSNTYNFYGTKLDTTP